MTPSSNCRTSHQILDYLLTTAMLACFGLAGWNLVGNDVSEAAISSHSDVTPTSLSDLLPLTSDDDRSSKYATRNIEDLKHGDLVLAREEHGNSIEYRRIKEVYRRTSYHLRHLTFETKDGKQQKLQTTDEHPFWSVTDRAWIDAGDIKPGTQVISPTGVLQTLATTRRTEHPEGIPVFNFQVEDFHTYFVAETVNSFPLLVHNADCWEFAENFQKANGGTVVSITPVHGSYIGKLPNDPRGFMENHRFATREGKIFDLANPDGIPAKEWFDQYRSLNDVASTAVLRRLVDIKILD